MRKSLPMHLPARLWKDALENGIGIITYEKDEILSGTEPDKYMEIEAKINQLPIVYKKDFGTYVNFPVNKCLMTGAPSFGSPWSPVIAKY